MKTPVFLISRKTVTWVSLGGRWGSNIEDNLNIQAVPKKIICFGNRAKQDLESSKWHNNTSMDALDNGESEIAGFKLTERITVEHYNVFGRASFLTSPSHTFFETYF